MKAEFKIVSAAVEAVAASSQMGVTSAFSFGKGAGILEGILIASGIKIIAVQPSVWKRGLGTDKKASVIRANEVLKWPEPIKHDGLAEAALIGWHVLNEVEPW